MEKIIIANIRYADDRNELKPLGEQGIQYVKRHGCVTTEYNKLDYSKMKEYGYPPLSEEELPASYFDKFEVEYINSTQYDEYLQRLNHE